MRLTFFIFCLILQLCISGMVIAQYKYDSLYKASTDVFPLTFNHPDSAINVGRNILQHSGDDKPIRGNIYNAIGWAHKLKGNNDSAIYYLNNAVAIFSSLKKWRDVALVHMNISEVYTFQSNFSNGLTHILIADSLAKKLKDMDMQTAVKRVLGIIYRESGDPEKATEYLREAMNDYLTQKNYDKYIPLVSSICMIYNSRNQTDSSLALLQSAIQLADEQDISVYQKAMLQECIGDVYMLKNRYPAALQHYLLAYELFKKLDNKGDIAFEAFNIGKANMLLSRYPAAEEYLGIAYRISDSIQAVNYQIDISSALSELYAKWGNWTQAHYYLQRNVALKDSLSIADQMTRTNELKEKYESEKKESQIKLLHAEKDRIKWGYLSAILGITLMVLLVLFLRNRRKVQEEKILNYFATSLYNQNTVDDVFWDIAKNCISRLHFEDCVIYGYDRSRNMLVQKAAYGPKNPSGHLINNALEIPLGKGIVGSVAKNKKAEIVSDTTRDERYILDDQKRGSEIAIPILLEDKTLLGVIDSEHSKRNFFTKRHLKLLQRISVICVQKITRQFVEEGLRNEIASDLHDEIGSALSSIDINSRSALNHALEHEMLKAQLQSIRDQAQQTMENMSDIVWSVNPVHDTLDSILIRMKTFASDICEPLGVLVHFTENMAEGITQKTFLSSIARKNVFLIFKEAVNNAVKYSKCENLYLDISLDPAGHMTLAIKDDGIGFNINQTKMGNGINNIKHRAEQINFKVTILSRPGEGTTIELEGTI